MTCFGLPVVEMDHNNDGFFIMCVVESLFITSVLLLALTLYRCITKTGARLTDVVVVDIQRHLEQRRCWARRRCWFSTDVEACFCGSVNITILKMFFRFKIQLKVSDDTGVTIFTMFD